MSIVKEPGGGIRDEIPWSMAFRGNSGLIHQGELKLAHVSEYIFTDGYLMLKQFCSCRLNYISIKTTKPVMVSLVTLPHETSPKEKGNWASVSHLDIGISQLDLLPGQWFALLSTKLTDEEADVIVVFNGLLRRTFPDGK